MDEVGGEEKREGGREVVELSGGLQELYTVRCCVNMCMGLSVLVSRFMELGWCGTKWVL